MFHNIKADIIYFKTHTDFELEFNLCGCCRMRLLSDKMQDKKSFVHSLARAVSRSSVILVAGPLFDECGTIQAVTEALNTVTEKVDNAAYGIKGEQEISIIKNATPLVTSEGVFGGCVIESGPQTMILLTDNKDVRKTIMQELIHSYIQELYDSEVTVLEGLVQGETVTNDNLILDGAPIPEDLSPIEDINGETEEAPALEDQETLEEQSEEETYDEIKEVPKEALEDQELEAEEKATASDETLKDVQLEPTVELTTEAEEEKEAEQQEIFEDDAQEPEDDEVVELFIKPTKLEREDVDRFTREYSQHADVYDYDQEDYYEEASRRNKGFSLAVLIISILLLIVIVVLCFCIFFVPSNQGVSPVSNLQEIFSTMFG